nr:DUF2599 domain-containing protein [uncultured Actinotalea sp.]
MSTAAVLMATLATGASADEADKHGTLETPAGVEVQVYAPAHASIRELPTASVVEISQPIQSAQDDSASIEFSMPAGAELVAGPAPGDEGLVAVDADGNLLFAVTQPQVVDARGRTIDAVVSVSGDRMLVSVEAADPEYPVVVSAAAISDLINKVTRTTTSRGYIWEVQPTAYGRAAAEWIHAAWGWPEAVRKGVPNSQGLQEQYLCHPMSQVARVKPTWNLDSWRPTVGLPATIAALCNP